MDVQKVVNAFVPQFRVRLQRIGADDARWLAIRACNGDTVPLASTIQKNLSVHVDNSQANRQFAVNDGVSSSLPELSFNRLQLSEQEYCVYTEGISVSSLLVRQCWMKNIG